MALTARHTFVSAIADDPGSVLAGEILPSHWNAVLSVAGTLAQADVTGLAASLAGKSNTLHTHVIADTAGLQVALDGKQISGAYANAVHTHAQAEITGLTVDLASKQSVLVSGVTIKTVNGTSLLGAGNITIATGAAPSGLQTFGYNANGDIISVTGPSGATKTISYVNGQPTQIIKVASGVTTTTTLTYGANGVATKTVVIL